MKKHNIIYTTIIVSLIAIFAKLIGFGREAIIASFFGANAATDAYFLAQSMPSMIFPAVCSSISTAFLSIYVSKNIKEGEDSGNRFVSRAMIVTLLIAFALSIIGFVLMPLVVPLFAPGFNSSTLKLAIVLSQVTMISFTLTMLQYMLTAILNSKKFFHGAQVAGVLHSVLIIFVTFFFGKGQTVEFLTWTVVGGLFIQILVLLRMAKDKVKLTLRINPMNKDIKAMIRLAVPILLGNSVVQINIIIDKVLASRLAEGAVSALSYSNSLNSIVTSVFIISLSTVLYPTLTQNASENNNNHFAKNLLQNLKMLIIIIVPISVITIIYSYDIVKIVFERGSFNILATKLTSSALVFYATGYAFIAIREIIIRGFYAIEDSKTPMYNGALSVVINIILSIILASIMGIGGIALASSISALICSFILIWSVIKKMPYVNICSIFPTMLKVFVAAIVSLILLYLFTITLSISTPLLRVALGTLIGFSIYYITLIILKCNEVKLVLSINLAPIKHVKKLFRINT